MVYCCHIFFLKKKKKIALIFEITLIIVILANFNLGLYLLNLLVLKCIPSASKDEILESLTVH